VFLATEAQRIGFFFQAVPLFFFAALSVCFTLLLALDRLPFMGRRFRAAARRSRETGALDRPGAAPLASFQAMQPQVPDHYCPQAREFFYPMVGACLVLGLLVALEAIHLLPFGLLLSAGLAVGISYRRGLDRRELTSGISGGLWAVLPVGGLLTAAIFLGVLSQVMGAGTWVAEIAGPHLAYWALPIFCFVLTFLIAFGTGTSWGTFAVTLPLLIPLGLEVSALNALNAELLFCLVIFAAAINGSIFGDQCSPISDTSILSSMATGCDLMDHVKTQMVPSACAAVFAVLGWTLLVLLMIKPLGI